MASRAAPARAGLLIHTCVFTLGIVAALRLPALLPSSVLLALSIPALLPWRARRLWASALLGLLLASLQAQRVLSDRWPAARTGEEVEVRGVVVSLPQRTVNAAAADTDADATDESVARTATLRFAFDADDAARAAGVPAHLRVSWYRTDAQPQAAECWTLRLRLRTPHGSRNPGGFDYEARLFRDGVGATATVRSGQSCGAAAGYRLLRLRQALSQHFDAWLPGHPAEPLIAALAVGDTSGLTDADWQTFRLTGTTHLVAISGFNIAIVAGVAFFLLRWLWSASAWLCLRLPAQRAALAGAALLAFGYAALSGFEAPVQRAAWMLMAVALAASLGGLTRPLRALLLAWLLVLALDPLAVLAPGLWLSFGAVAAIFYAASGRVETPPAWRSAVSLQLMLSLVLAPLTIAYFDGVSLSGPLVNLIAVPIVAIATPTVIAALLAAWTWPGPGLWLLHGLADGLAWLQGGLEGIAARTPAAWIAAAPSPTALLLAGVGALLLFAPRAVPLRMFGLLCLLPALLPPTTAPARDFRVTVLDVGQGLSVVVRTAHHSLLFDTGPAFPEGLDTGRAIVAPYLLHDGLRRLDRMIVSHADLDHRGGAPAVRTLVRVDDEIGAMVPEKPCVDGDEWTWDGVRFRILNGPAPGRSDNDGGCVLKIESPGFSALLPADIEAVSEARLVAEYGGQLRADLLVTPHHGSRTSSSPAFVAAVAPKVVVHSAGWHHRFHHPRPEVVARYRSAGAEQVNTATAGAVSIAPGSDRIEVTRERSASPRLWSTDDP